MAKRPTVRDRVRAFALGLPEAFEDFPWGERVAKIKGKVFVFLGHDDFEHGPSMSVKLADSNAQALMVPGSEPTGYGLGRSGWVTVPLSKEAPPLGVLTDWIEESYRLVAPKRISALLDEPRKPPKRELNERMKAASLGLRARSGTAALVVVEGPVEEPTVIGRRQLALIPDGLPHGQVFHHFRELTAKEMEPQVRRASTSATSAAVKELRATLKSVEGLGRRVNLAGIVLGGGRAPATVEEALRSHAARHAAEGEFYRRVLIAACERLGIRVVGTREGELFGRAASVLGVPEAKLRVRVTEMGRAVGSPWTAYEKAAALAAWLAMAGKR